MLRAWLALALCLPWLPGTTARAQPLAAIPPLDAPVVDATGTLSAEEIARLSQRARELQQRKGSQLQILIVPSTQPEDIAQYAQRVFDQWKLGRAEVDDGVLLLIAKDDRRARIHTGYGLEGAIPDITAGRVIQEYLVPKFRAGDFYGGIDEATGALAKLIDGEALPAPMAPQPGGNGAGGDGGNALFALFAAYMIATLVRGLLGSAGGGIRGVSTGLAAGGVAWVISSIFVLGVFAGILGLVYGLIRVPRGRYVRRGGWDGIGSGGGWGGSSGGGWGGSSGGGWSGGGGSSGGGGASGSW